ncbi:MAG: DUF4080 domain-containing protein [Candidatus Izemoplasmatales bacterium]|nr:DUF4080 domain-containing protein [Candidatus Izemoplasmatales bacterium]MDD4354942.1 DUF4080 domain-containing protein [Candidatus Izemoplasmatales bacterium]MDD4987875.1 DUF4080 domain-containing protein [Candidatus Izemoplasmatales bacterium]MDD5601938.1 DUF4080 domain-containing protein [Candidatus Izemoplasmatales bacterium]MDY0373617.1 DUF4080 domain-containing protein [Candidatus Izemoplasmatales bacterium]
MKILLVSIDSKYIHTNLAVRYLKANCDFPVEVLEFTIKDPLDKIVSAIKKAAPDLIGFGVYIWNLLLIKQLTRAIKQALPARILWGGPEVSYDAESFLKDDPVDFILVEEAELAFNRLIHALIENSSLAEVSNLVYRDKGVIRQNPVDTIDILDSLKNPYLNPDDDQKIPNRIQYVESSRGCPFACTYCLASLKRQVRLFPLERVKADLDRLQAKGAKTFKFLDRTFNLDPNRVIELLKHIASNHHPGTSFQFEICGDLLTDQLIDDLHEFAPPGLFRFEIGIQTTNSHSIIAVKRKQNLEKLLTNIKRLQRANIIDLHLDLIAGLPGETWDSFRLTFDQVFRLHAKELQLGFLKFLRGTPLRRDAETLGYLYDPFPPYEIRHSPTLSEDDLDRIRQVEAMHSIYWNKGFLNATLRWITERIASPTDFFLNLANFYQTHHYDATRYQLADVFYRFDAFMKEKYPEIQVYAHHLLKQDYLAYHTLKPKIWWEQKAIHKNDILRRYYEYDKTFSLDILYKYALVTTAETGYLIALYLPEGLRLLYLK